jgi:hypothetical protein
MFTTATATAIAAMIIATNVYAQEDLKYYTCEGEVTNLNPNFNVTLNRDELKDSYWSDCSGKWPIFDTNNGIGLSKCITISGYLNKLINDGDDKNKLYCSHNYKDEWILSFRSPFICKNNIYKLNHIIYNGESILYCGDSYDSENNHDVQFKSAMICEDYIHDKHIFEHFVRCASSENGYPNIPYKGKCNCLPDATGPLCQYTNKDTCYCNGKAKMNGFCSCEPGYSGLYCNIGTSITPTKTSTTRTSTTLTTRTSTTLTTLTTRTSSTPTKITTRTSTTSTKITTRTSTTSTKITITSTFISNIITPTSTVNSTSFTKKTPTSTKTTSTTKTNTTTSSNNIITHESINNKDTATIVILVILVIFIIAILLIPVGIYCYNNCKKSIPTIPPTHILRKSNDPPSYENPVYDTHINSSTA